MGVVIPLRDVAEINEENGYAEIHRFENKRSITVSATVNKEQISAFDVNQKLIQEFSDIEPLYPGYQLDFRGIFDQIQESFRELIKLFMVGFLLMYAILGTQFKSFLQPFIIMFAVPFGVIGAMVGLLCIGAALSIIAMFGIVALSGIVVNDAIVLIDFINKRRLGNGDVTEAIVIGSCLCLHPIILMAIGLGGKSPIWVLLTYIIIFGLFFPTLLTLFVMPNLYAVIGDIGNFFRRFPAISNGIKQLRFKYSSLLSVLFLFQLRLLVRKLRLNRFRHPVSAEVPSSTFPFRDVRPAFGREPHVPVGLVATHQRYRR
jgi:multidrug efflux pump subunit AcrB